MVAEQQLIQLKILKSSLRTVHSSIAQQECLLGSEAILEGIENGDLGITLYVVPEDICCGIMNRTLNLVSISYKLEYENLFVSGIIQYRLSVHLQFQWIDIIQRLFPTIIFASANSTSCK